MSDDQIVCGRCGGTNRPGSARCWVCYTPLDTAASAGAEAPAATLRVAGANKKTSNPLIIALKIVVVLSIIIALIPVLLIITCFGILAVSNPSFR
jgi:hypothetical protein